MPLVSVTTISRKGHKFVAADSLEQLIQRAINKFDLPPEEEFKICLEATDCSGGTQIDEDDIFKELLKDLTKGHLTVMILKCNEDWPSFHPVPPAVAPQNETQPTPSSSGSQPQPQPQQNNTAASQKGASNNSMVRTETWIDESNHVQPLPMTHICEILDDVLLQIQANDPKINIIKYKKRAITKVYKSIKDFMLEKTKQYSLKVCRKYAEDVFSHNAGAYAEIFKVYINGSYANSGLNSFITKIYNSVNYSKGDENKQKRGKRTRKSLSDDEENEGSEDDPEEFRLSRKKRVQDEYGCVRYSPPLPPGEDKTTQEEKRKSLIAFVEDPLNETATNLMKETFSTQRLCIISTPVKKLITIFQKWPLLQNSYYLFEHASYLLDKKVKEIFKRELDEKASDIFKFMKNLWGNALRESPEDKTVHEMITVVTAVTVAQNELRTTMPQTLGIFPLIAGYMRENIGAIIQVVNVNADEQDVKDAAAAAALNPVLVVKGTSLYDETAQFIVVVGNECLIEVIEALDGILLVFLSYYIFGINYPKEIMSTLEFIQRFFLSINPPTGTKRDVHSRYNNVNTKVTGLSDELKVFSSQSQIWALKH